jgi:hypothetical protein
MLEPGTRAAAPQKEGLPATRLKWRGGEPRIRAGLKGSPAQPVPLSRRIAPYFLGPRAAIICLATSTCSAFLPIWMYFSNALMASGIVAWLPERHMPSW